MIILLILYYLTYLNITQNLLRHINIMEYLFLLSILLVQNYRMDLFSLTQ